MLTDPPPAVLIVEDDPGIAELEKTRLEETGYTVLLAGTAEEAIAHLRAGRVDLILLDYRLPGAENGLDFYARVKAAGYDVPVILVTGFGSETTVIQALRVGVRDFVTKSVEYLDYLPAAVGRVLRQVQTEHRLAESEARLAAVIGSAKDAVIVTEADRAVSLFNPAAERMFGCPAAAAVGRKITDFIPDELGPPPGTPDDPDAVTTSQRLRAGTRGVRAGGEDFPLEASVSRGQANGRRFYTVVVRDVTDRVRAEEALRASEWRFKAFMDNSPALAFIKDADGRYVYVSRPTERLFGRPLDEWVGRTDADFFPAGEAERLREHDRQVLASGRPAQYQESVGVNGSPRQFLALKFPFQDRAARPWLAGVAVDVTEQTRAEEARRASDRRFRAVFDQAAVGIALVAPDETVVAANPGFSRLLDHSADEVADLTVRAVSHPDDYPLCVPLMGDVRAGRRENFSVEKRYVRKDGSYVWAAVTVSAIRAPGGEIEYWLVIAQDITVRRAAEERLREQAALLDMAHDAIKVTDLDGRIRYWSRGAERLYGWSAAEAVGRDVESLLYRGRPDERREAVRRVLGDGEWAGELQQVTRAGKEIIARCSWSLVRTPAGEPDGVLMICTDVSERGRLEQQLRQAQKMEVVGQLAGGVAHDFNNLLTVINGFSDLALDALPPGDPVREMVGEVRRSGDRAAGLTRQLLAFSRQQLLEPKVFDLNEAVRDAGRMLRRLIGEDVELSTSLSAGPVRVKADPGQVEQIIMNLAVNARDAMPTGGRLTIETAEVDLDETNAAARPDVRPGRYALLAVSDTGCGMDEATTGRIFEPFFTTKGFGKGTGLGLSTVWGIVKQSGGYVEVYSEPARGTAIKVYLPATPEAADGSKGHAVYREGRGGTETVLLVEDEPAVRQLARTALAAAGYAVLEAGRPEDAVEVARSHGGPIHLLVTDVVMPGMGGRQLAERVAGLRPGVKVLYLSGYTPDAVVRHGVLQADVAFLQKPFSVRALTRKVREVLDGGG